jgi:IS30 family transposase
MDCVVSGKGKGKAALLVLTERKFRKEIIRKMPEKTQKSVKKTLDRLEREYGARFSEVFKTITVDNGSEFLNSVELESSIRKPALIGLKSIMLTHSAHGNVGPMKMLIS